MIRVFSPNDKIFTSNGDADIQLFKTKVHKEDNGKFYLDIEADISYADILTANRIIVAGAKQGSLYKPIEKCTYYTYYREFQLPGV